MRWQEENGKAPKKHSFLCVHIKSGAVGLLASTDQIQCFTPSVHNGSWYKNNVAANQQCSYLQLWLDITTIFSSFEFWNEMNFCFYDSFFIWALNSQGYVQDEQKYWHKTSNAYAYFMGGSTSASSRVYPRFNECICKNVNIKKAISLPRLDVKNNSKK